MEMKLAENIRLFRKQRSLTQEQLSEVLGVTVGDAHGGKVSSGEIGLTVKESGRVLPCGSTAIWER